MDSLVQKTQKLKINMPPTEEYLARHKAQAKVVPAAKPATAARKPAEPRKVGRPPKAAGAATTVTKKPPSAAAAAAKAKSPTNDLTPDIPGTGAFQVQPATVGASAVEPASIGTMTGQFQLEPTPTPSITSATTASDPAPMSSPAEISFPTYGNGFPTMAPVPSTVTHTQPLVWSSTGAIPFATDGQPQVPKSLPTTTVVPEIRQEEAVEEKDIWDVPETLAK
jgi:hypothetical protein